MSSGIKDLGVLIADKNMEGALRGLLSRPHSLGLRSISFDLYVHPERDPGCRLRGHEFLRPFTLRYTHALVVFDLEGSGQDKLERSLLEHEVEGRLSSSGWQERAAAVVIDPELEAWVWNESPHVATTLGWDVNAPPLKDWLREKGWLAEGAVKPSQPKKAVEEALRRARKPRSSSLYFELAQKVSFDRCVDTSFLRFREILSCWFPR